MGRRSEAPYELRSECKFFIVRENLMSKDSFPFICAMRSKYKEDTFNCYGCTDYIYDEEHDKNDKNGKNGKTKKNRSLRKRLRKKENSK